MDTFINKLSLYINNFSNEQQLNIFNKINDHTTVNEFVDLIDTYNTNTNCGENNNNCNNSLLKDEMTKAILNNPTISSIEKGNVGEEVVMNLLNPIFPKCNIINVGKIPHSCDIDITDDELKIKYAVEVKNKKVILTEDVEKFERDIQRLREVYKDKYIVIGLFLSFNSNKIPTKGDIYFTDWCLYLSEYSITPEIIKCFIEVTKSTRPMVKYISQDRNNEEHYKTLSTDLIEAISKLKYEYNSLTSVNNSLQLILKNSSESYNEATNIILTNNKLLSAIEVISQSINNNYNINLLETNKLTINKKNTYGISDQLYEYILNTKKSNLTIKSIKSKFPLEKINIKWDMIDKIKSEL